MPPTTNHLDFDVVLKEGASARYSNSLRSSTTSGSFFGENMMIYLNMGTFEESYDVHVNEDEYTTLFEYYTTLSNDLPSLQRNISDTERNKNLTDTFVRIRERSTKEIYSRRIPMICHSERYTNCFAAACIYSSYMQLAVLNGELSIIEYRHNACQQCESVFMYSLPSQAYE